METKLKTHIRFEFSSKCWPEAQKLFKNIDRTDLAEMAKRRSYSFDFTDDGQLMNFINEAYKLGFRLDEHIFRKYEIIEEDLCSFHLFEFSTTSMARDRGGPSYGTRYDLSKACPECWSGAEQISPLMLEGSENFGKKKVNITHYLEYLVNEEVAQMLRHMKFTGFKLMEVFSSKSNSKLHWFHVLPEFELPPMSSSTKGIKRGNTVSGDEPCSLCGRDGHFSDPMVEQEIYYDSSIPRIDDLPDFMLTYEHFGKTICREGRIKIANPRIIVKERVVDFFRSRRIPGPVFYRVHVE
jgi:hypothetical protein